MKIKNNNIFVVLGMLLLLISVSSARDLSKSSLKVIVGDDSVIVSVDGADGSAKSVKIDKATFSGGQKPEDIQVKNEILIDNDKIIIDGVEYNSSAIDGLLLTREDDRAITIFPGMPSSREQRGKKIIRVDGSNDRDRVEFSGFEIPPGEVISGDAVAFTGDVKVYGKVKGDIVSVFGNIFLFESSDVGGDVVAPFGKVITTNGSRIEGELISRDNRCDKTHKTNFEIDARFDRVEGFTPLGRLHYRDKKQELPEIDASVGYAFALRRWDLDLGFKQHLGSESQYYFGGKYYRGAYTSDNWFFTQEENTIAGLFFKEDYHDFYSRKGISAFIGKTLFKRSFVQIEFAGQANGYLNKNTNHAILGGKKRFRNNYSTVLPDSAAILGLNGDLRILGLRYGYNSNDKEIHSHQNLKVDLLVQTAGDGSLGNLGGDFTYDIAEASIIRNQPITPRQYLGIRLRTGYSDQNLPLDRWFFLGGVGSLRGYDFKEFAGNRYLLANIDYYWEFSGDFGAALFADLGQTGFGERQFVKTGLKTDLGIGLMIEDAFRIDIAQRLDDTGKSPVVTARFEWNF